MYVRNECRQTLFSVQYVKSGFASGVRGDFSLVVDGFMCKRCDSPIQETHLAEDLVVDGETYGYVKSSVIGETLLIKVVEQLLPLQLKSEMDEWNG